MSEGPGGYQRWWDQRLDAFRGAETDDSEREEGLEPTLRFELRTCCLRTS